MLSAPIEEVRAETTTTQAVIPSESTTTANATEVTPAAPATTSEGILPILGAAVVPLPAEAPVQAPADALPATTTHEEATVPAATAVAGPALSHGAADTTALHTSGHIRYKAPGLLKYVLAIVRFR